MNLVSASLKIPSGCGLKRDLVAEPFEPLDGPPDDRAAVAVVEPAGAKIRVHRPGAEHLVEGNKDRVTDRDRGPLGAPAGGDGNERL